MKLEKGIEEFQKHCYIYKSFATYKYQQFHLNTIRKYFTANNIISFNQIKQNELDSMILYFKRTCKNITINKKILLLKQVYAYNNIKCSFNFKKLKQEQNRSDIFTEQELAKILNYADKLSSINMYELTRKLIILILLDTGCRQSELLNIKIKNINLESNCILLTSTKTKKDRLVYLSKMSIPFLKPYIDNSNNRENLFYNYKSKKDYCYRNLRTFLDRLKSILKIKTINARMFRHTMATILIENGAALSSVQNMLGHSNINTTEIYLHLSVRKIKSDFEKYSVLNTKSEE